MHHNEDESLYFGSDKIHRLTSRSSSRTSLFRVYSENERANFDQITGSRVYDDDVHRPIPSDSQKLTTRSKQRRYSVGAGVGKRNLNEMQDEYVPEIDFADEVTKWLDDDPAASPNEPRFKNPWSECVDENITHYSPLSSSHAQVKPIPLPNTVRGSLLAPQEGSPQNEPENFELPKTDRNKRASYSDSFSSSLGDISGSTLHELKMTPEEAVELITKLPQEYSAMPYSQRKKIVMELLPARDYRVIMSWIKKCILTSPKSATSLHTKGSFANLPVAARSRQNSVASQYLSSFSPANTGFGGSGSGTRPDDKGSLIMGHLLGKIIGFGAWGMIRECVDVQTGAVRAIKIVRFKNNYKVKSQVMKEVAIWKELKHKNILELWKWKLDDDYAIYCLTDRINDGTLYDLVISWGEVETSKIHRSARCKQTLELCLQVIQALKYMHSNCIAHGDVKLENCLLEKGPKKIKVVLCDFGMSNRFRPLRCAPKHREHTTTLDAIESTSPLNGNKVTTSRKPIIPKSRSHASFSSSRHMSQLQKIIKNRKLTHDDTPLGVSSLPRTYGPSLSSAHVHNMSEPSLHHLVSPAKLMPTMDISAPHSGSNPSNVPDPHSHIGSLPYAAPELLGPSPPPLGPSADVWALGVMLYTMLTGKLPFRHDFEPRLRAMIASGKYDKDLLNFACHCESVEGVQGLHDAIVGSLSVEVSARWSLSMIEHALRDDLKR